MARLKGKLYKSLVGNKFTITDAMLDLVNRRLSALTPQSIEIPCSYNLVAPAGAYP